MVCFRLRMYSRVPRPDIKPACLSGVSGCICIWFQSFLNNIQQYFAGMRDKRYSLIVRTFCYCTFFINRDKDRYTLIQYPDFYTLMQDTVLITSPTIPSEPADVFAFIFLKATSTSDPRISCFWFSQSGYLVEELSRVVELCFAVVFPAVYYLCLYRQQLLFLVFYCI